MINYFKQNKFLFLISFIFLLIRLPFLGQMYLLHDERDIIMSGYSIAKTGHDLYGHLMPISFGGINPDNPLFAIYFSALGWLFMPGRSVFAARFPFVMVSTTLIFLVYEIIYMITKDKKLSIITTIIFCFSPWVFHLTRLAMDVSVAIVYILIAILLYLKNKRWISYIFLFLTFYTYQGFRILIPILLIYLEIFFLIQKNNYKKFAINNVLNILFFAALLLSIVFIDARITANRFDQLVFSKNEVLTQDVNFKRNTTIAPPLISKLFYNKITVSFDYMVSTFIKGQDFSYLFKTGDFSAINGNASSGQFFLVFFIFYYAGLIIMGKRMKINNFYIAGFALIGLLPAIVRAGSVTFSIRSMVSVLGFSFVIALGLKEYFDLKNLINKKLYVIFNFILLSFLAINVTYFTYDYYFRRPISVGEQYNENERILTTELLSSADKQIIYHMYPYEPYMSYAFLNQSVNFSDIQNALSNQKTYIANNILFLKCIKYTDLMKQENIIIHERCLSEKEYEGLLNSKRVYKTLHYHDYSQKIAYFFIK